MSQYLSQFYCGNKRGHCNYNEPIDYQKLLNRNFDSTLLQVLEDCQGKDFEKGFCCDPVNKELAKPMDDVYMEKINQKFEAQIFTKNEHGQFHRGQIPLIRPLLKDNKMVGADICSCGGESDDYVKCVSENCSDYRYPTRYEYCKLGSDMNKTYCVDSLESAPAPSQAYLSELTSQERCKLHPVDPNTQSRESPNYRLNELAPDCYINNCTQEKKLNLLDELISNTTTDENKYFNLKGDSLRAMDFYRTEEKIKYIQENQDDKSLLGYFSSP